MGFRNVSGTACAMSMLLLLPNAADAQESGSFRILQSYVQDYTTIEHAGGTVTAGTLVGTSTVTESSGPPFAEGVTDIAKCLVYVRTPRDGAVELEAACTVTDGAGDEMYLLARRRDGSIAAGGGGAGVFEILGGTGKYADVSGECPYTTQYHPEDHADVSGKCTWQRP